VRLAPVDYHHVHYCDDGRSLDHDRLGRRLWTVNQHALRNKQDILFSNERSINILETRNFGCLAFVEIGALSVDPSCKFIRLMLPLGAAKRNRSFASAVQPSLCSAKKARGGRPRAS
jgi:hypothetical protein